jgi:hypothetical protein
MDTDNTEQGCSNMHDAFNTYTVLYDYNRLLLYTSINLQAPSQ